jgi:hypothetical protein
MSNNSLLERKVHCSEIWEEKSDDYLDPSETCIDEQVHYSPKYDTCIYYANCTMSDGTSHRERVYDILTNDLLFWTNKHSDEEFMKQFSEAIGR